MKTNDRYQLKIARNLLNEQVYTTSKLTEDHFTSLVQTSPNVSTLIHNLIATAPDENLHRIFVIIKSFDWE